MSDFTQEQVDVLIATKIAEAKTGLFTEEELTRRVTSEVDRRVESGIQKGLETSKQKWEQEFSTKAKMSAEDLAKQEFESKWNEVSIKEKEVLKLANKVDAKDLLTEAGVPKSHYDKFITLLVSEDGEVTKSNVQNFIDMFNQTKSEIETKVKSEFSQIKKPDNGGHDEGITKDKFAKMGYGEKLALKNSNPEIYKEMMK